MLFRSPTAVPPCPPGAAPPPCSPPPPQAAPRHRGRRQRDACEIPPPPSQNIPAVSPVRSAHSHLSPSTLGAFPGFPGDVGGVLAPAGVDLVLEEGGEGLDGRHELAAHSESLRSCRTHAHSESLQNTRWREVFASYKHVNMCAYLYGALDQSVCRTIRMSN